MEQEEHIIYKILNKVNGKIYIGYTKRGLVSRWASHCAAARNNPKSSSYNRALMRAIRKYGEESFSIEEIDTASNVAAAGAKEIWWIKELDCKIQSGKGYNLTDGGEGVRGWIMPAKRRKEISSQNSGTRNYWYGKSGLASPHYGKPIRPEHIEKLKLNNGNNIEVVINGVTYRSKHYASEVLNVSRTSIDCLINWQKSIINVKAERVIINGVKYYGLKNAAKILGLSVYKLKKSLRTVDYIKTPWSFEEFLEYTRTLQKYKRAIEIDGVIYESLKAFTKATGKDRDVALRLIREGIAVEVDYKLYRPSHNSRAVKFCDVRFESKTKLLEYFNISGKEFSRLVSSGEIELLDKN